MACGTGKTEVMRWIVDALAPVRVAVMAPSIALCAQTWQRWAGSMGWRGRGLAICSDSTARVADDIRVVDAGLPAVTTDPTVAAAFLASPQPCVVFCTYQSAGVLAGAAREVGGLDLVVCDEAHRLAGKIDGAFGCVLDDDVLPARRRLFLTATPRVFDAKADDVVSMDDARVFGPVVYRYTFGQAIDGKWLTDYDVVVFAVPESSIRDHIEDADGAADAAAAFGLAKAMRRFNLRRGLSFHTTVARARAFAAAVPAAAAALPAAERPTMPVVGEHVSGAMPASRRGETLRLLTLDDQHTLIANARCLGEGVDVPAIEFVAFIDPKSSHIDLVQAVGRAMRPSHGKRRARIVIPVYVAEGESAESVLASSRYRLTMSVLRALREHDDRLGEKIKMAGAWSRGEGAPDGIDDDTTGDGPRLVFGLPEWLLSAIAPRMLRDSSGDPMMDIALDIKTRWADSLTQTDIQWLYRRRSRRGVDLALDAELDSWPGWAWADSRAAIRAMSIRARWPDLLTSRDRVWLHSRRNSKGVNPEIDAELSSWPGWTWTCTFAMERAAAIRTRWPDALTLRDRRWLNDRRTRRGSNETVDAELASWPGWAWVDTRVMDRANDIKTRWGRALSRRDRHWLAERRVHRGRNPDIDAELESWDGWTWGGKIHQRAPYKYSARAMARALNIKHRWGSSLTTTDKTWLMGRRQRRGVDLALDAELDSWPGWAWSGPLVPTHDAAAVAAAAASLPAAPQARDDEAAG